MARDSRNTHAYLLKIPVPEFFPDLCLLFCPVPAPLEPLGLSQKQMLNHSDDARGGKSLWKPWLPATIHRTHPLPELALYFYIQHKLENAESESLISE